MNVNNFSSQLLQEILPASCHSRLWASGWLAKSINERLNTIIEMKKHALTEHHLGTGPLPDGYKLYPHCGFLYSIGDNAPITVEIQFDKWGDDKRVLSVVVPEMAWAQFLANYENRQVVASDYEAMHDAYGRLKVSEGFGPVGARDDVGRQCVFSWQE